MKKLLKALCLIAAAVILFLFISEGGIDYVHNFLQSVKNDINDKYSDYGKPKIDYTVCEQREGNKLISAQTVIAQGQHSEKTIDSWYDDDNYCYVVYLGRVKNFILYDLYTFEYTNAMPVFGNFSVSIKQTNRQAIEKTYTNTLQKTTNNTIHSALTNTVGSSITAAAAPGQSAEVSATVESSLERTWTANCTETNTEIFYSLTDQTNEIIESFTLDYSKCEPGTFYSFASIVDIDVYVAMCYNPTALTLEYKYYTDVLGKARQIAFSSTNDSFLYDDGVFEIDAAAFNFKKPQKYITNHPKKQVKIIKEQTYTVKDQDKVTIVYDGVGTHPITGETIENEPQRLFESGYDKVDVTVSFNYMNYGDAKMRFHVGDTADRHEVFFEKETTDETDKNYTFTIDLNKIIDFGKIYFIFENKNHLFHYKIKAFKATLTFYYSGATYS